ncbi:MAG: efflux RND transporter periplasmic adaptor subunit [Acidiferrobacterales bacterium]
MSNGSNSVSSSQKRGKVWLFLLLLCALTGAGVGAWYLSRPKPIGVVLWSVDHGRVEASVANTRAGTVEACQRARMAPPTGGQVARLPVRAGDRVRAGQELLSLWNEDLKAELKLAKSEAKAAKARTQEACALAKAAEREAKRLLSLKKSRLVSEDTVDQAVADADAGEAACRAAGATAEVSRVRVSVARSALERTILVAPFDGVVAEVNAKLGEFVTPSPPGIPTLPAIDLIGQQCLYVTAPIDEVDAPAVQPGQTTRITLDAFAGRSFDGQVKRVAPYVLDREKQARTVEVEAAFTDPKETKRLLPGYSADLEIVLDTREKVLRVPTEAVLEGYRVLVYRPQTQRLQERRFEPGLANWKFTEVRSGLEAGDQIVVSVEREGVEDGAYVLPEVPKRTP